MFRKIGQAYGKIKGVASEFNTALSDVNVKSKIEEDIKKLDEEFQRPSFDFASIEKDIKKRQAETAELIAKQKQSIETTIEENAGKTQEAETKEETST